MPIVCIGLNHRTASVDVREQFAFHDGMVPEIFDQICKSTQAIEVVVLSTCNRVEIYAFSDNEPGDLLNDLRNFMIDGREFDDDMLYEKSGVESIEHLFKVASGLDSMVIGETEILGQLKSAYQIALEHKNTGSQLNRAFQKAFNTAKQIRTETNIQRGSVSVASVAVELTGKIFDTLSDRTVMVIGAGDTSEKTARALLSRGAKSVMVSNRSFERAQLLAKELGGRAIKFEGWENEFKDIDIIISSTSAPHYVIDRNKIEPLQKLRRHRPLLLIDIAVPRDIEPELNFLEDIYLYNIDDLQAIADDYLRLRRNEVEKCEAIVREKAIELLSVSPPSYIKDKSGDAAGESPAAQASPG